jgi:hypothetical protein
VTEGRSTPLMVNIGSQLTMCTELYETTIRCMPLTISTERHASPRLVSRLRPPVENQLKGRRAPEDGCIGSEGPDLELAMSLQDERGSATRLRLLKIRQTVILCDRRSIKKHNTYYVNGKTVRQSCVTLKSRIIKKG